MTWGPFDIFRPLTLQGVSCMERIGFELLCMRRQLQFRPNKFLMTVKSRLGEILVPVTWPIPQFVINLRSFSNLLSTQFRNNLNITLGHEC